MELDIDGHRGHAGPPDSIEDLQVLPPNLHGDADAAGAPHAGTPAQTAGDPPYIILEFGIGHRSGIGGDCEPVGQAFGHPLHILRKIHGRPRLCSKSGISAARKYAMREPDGSTNSVSTSLAPQTSSGQPPALFELRGGIDWLGLRSDLQTRRCAQGLEPKDRGEGATTGIVRSAAVDRTRCESAHGPAG